MRYKLFGRSGLRVSELCLGTMTFGEESGLGSPRDEARKIYDAFIEAGGNFLDTANIYSQGHSEAMLGDFMAEDRERLVLATKYANNTATDDPNAGGNHRKNMVQALEASLTRLQTDYVDIYWVHIWDYTTPVDEVMRALDDLVRAGKVLHVAVSNTPAWIVSYANALAERHGWTPFSGLQLHYNLVERTCEGDFIPLAHMQNMAITPWSPLAGGLLTGKFDPDVDDSAAEGSRIANARWGVLTDEKRAMAQKVSQIAKEINASPSQVALNWLRQNKKATVIPIIGARTLTQLQDNLGCLAFTLSDDHIAQLNEICPPSFGYPADLLANPFAARMMHGEVGEKIDNTYDPR